jgi:hypothetical protein
MDKSKSIEAQLKQIILLVKECPENIQEKCFELLFNHIVVGAKSPVPLVVPDQKDETIQNPEAIENGDSLSSGDEIKLSDIHTKAKALIKNNGMTIEDINNLFYKEGGEFKPLFDDLKTTKMADSQIRLALLEALKNALKDGEFRFSIETVRSLCDTHKCYDKSNFAANFRNNKSLFADEYKKGATEIQLSPQGKKELSRIVEEIAR